MTIAEINMSAMVIAPATLIMLKVGFGHLTHSKLDSGWYFVSPIILQSVHRSPE